jgi:hypothetical protein
MIRLARNLPDASLLMKCGARINGTEIMQYKIMQYSAIGSNIVKVDFSLKNANNLDDER